ncbi:hypothetical protein P7C70_g2889, partial [Phenoliferia sp. Uapishka_3]
MSSNYSYYAIPAAWVVAMGPHFYAAGLSKSSKELPDFTNAEPREFIQRCRALEKQTPVSRNSSNALTLSTNLVADLTRQFYQVVKKYLRAEAASQNGFETMALFAVSILAGNVAKLSATTLNGFAAFYLGSRVLYNLLYINTTKEGPANARSVTYVAGIVSICTLFVKSSRALEALRF